ncbi:type II toxin-antitoxin system PemK/MazF family toxin [Candidatus Pacearchaeota archaeon]|nr:type II toxin-antitoxin system PemK/MazF family toxin [Candidatus Pacearchaeota archaeon]
MEKDSAALVFQLQTLDKKRLVSKIGDIESHYLDKINEIIKKLLKIQQIN